MKNIISPPIRSLGVRFEIEELLKQIHANPSVWNRHTMRTYGVHSDVSDIWVRYNAWENFAGNQSKFNEEHESVWYPVLTEIPAIKQLVLDVMRCVDGERLGGVLITKIPPGKEVKPHRDAGWHANYYEKFAVQLQSAPGQAFCFAENCLSAVPGELYTFDNSQTHWVLNQSQEDRMTLIICIRRPPCPGP